MVREQASCAPYGFVGTVNVPAHSRDPGIRQYKGSSYSSKHASVIGHTELTDTWATFCRMKLESKTSPNGSNLTSPIQ